MGQRRYGMILYGPFVQAAQPPTCRETGTSAPTDPSIPTAELLAPGICLPSERFGRTYKHEFFLHEDIPSLQIAKERTALWLDYYNGQRAHSTLGNQSPQMYTEAAGMTLEPHFLRDFYAAERHSSLRSSPSPSSGSRSYAPNSHKKWLALHRPA